MSYRVWIRAWVEREETFQDRDSAELFRLKLAASSPKLSPGDVVVVPDHASTSAARPPASGIAP